MRAAPLQALGISLFIVAAVSDSLQAQPGQVCPDGFLAGCCSTVAPAVSVPATMTISSAQVVCWNGCVPSGTPVGPVTITLLSTGPACATFVVNVNAPSVFFGTLGLHYTRHWSQVCPPTGQAEVFRFVVTGEVAPGLQWPCPTLETVPHPFFYGYIDYVYSRTPSGCGAPIAASIVLGHSCDAFMHPLAGCATACGPTGPVHAADAFAIVAPGSNFTPSNSLPGPPAGASSTAPTPRRGLRNLSPLTCYDYEPLSSGSLTNFAMGCFCNGTPVPQYTRQQIAVTTTCGSVINPLLLCPYSSIPGVPNATLFTWSIGSWGAGGPYQCAGPSIPYSVWLTEGTAVYDFGCPGGSVGKDNYYGAETRWQFPVPPGQRVDLVNNQDPATSDPRSGCQGTATRVVFLY